jgi:hypothetical protein
VIPYTDFLYFGISLYALVPGVILSLLRRFVRTWIVIATAIMLAIQYLGLEGDIPWPIMFVLVIGYTIFQLLIARCFARSAHRRRPIFYRVVGPPAAALRKYASLAG